MSAADNQWPAWLRRRSGVELLGPPSLFFARLTIALALVVVLYVGLWNAVHYPVSLGYDAQPNATYIHILFDEHHIPTAEQSGEANQPPAYYLLAGFAVRAGHELFHWTDTKNFPGFPEESFRGALFFNVLLVFLTALCVLWLARIVAPDRPWVWAASVGFLAFLPVVSKTGAMLHPENLSMLTSAAALASATHMFVRRTFSTRLLSVLAVSVGVGLATRTTMVFTAVAIAAGATASVSVPEIRARIPWRRLGVVLGSVVILATPWVIYRAVVHRQGPLNNTGALLDAALHPGSGSLLDRVTTHDPFFRVTPTSMFQRPWRSHYKNQAFSETYTEIWGDWLGAFAWSEFSGEPSKAAQRVLEDQSYIGVLPTLLAVAGWLGLCWVALRRRRDLVVLAVMPVFGVGGYLYRSWLALSHDGDLFKATYALNTVSVWALCFGLACAWLGSRWRPARFGLVILFAVFAVLELRFTMYGIRDGNPIF